MASVILRGPCIVKHGSLTIYTKDGVKVDHEDETGKISDDWAGANADLKFAGRLWKISCTPCGEMESASLYWPHQPSAIGSSLFGASDTSLVIHTKSGDVMTWTQAGISQLPPLVLATNKQAFGQMEFVATGNPAKTSSSFTDTTHDLSKIYTGTYTAALGSRTSPFDAITSRAGFEVTPKIAYDKVVDQSGVAGCIITDVWAEAKFAPANLTHAQYDELMPFDASSPLLVGQSYARDAEDLTITGGHCVFVLKNCGVMKKEYGYGVKLDRLGVVTFMTQAKTATGAVSDRYSVTFS